MIETITGALAALRSTIGLVKTAIEVRDDMKLVEALTGINDRIIAVQDACMRLQEANATLLQDKHTLAEEKRDLETQLMNARQQTEKLSQYIRIRTQAGALVFVDKDTVDTADDPVYACASCMDEGKVTTMQLAFSGEMLTCPIHGHIGLTKNTIPVPFTHPTK